MRRLCLIYLCCLAVSVYARNEIGRTAYDGSIRSNYEGGSIVMPTDLHGAEATIQSAAGTRWAILVAGSAGYGNYRHQADVCHAYQVLRRGGLKEEHIVVFMYDDIASNPGNPHPGVIINNPDGENVYAGVPKDYTGENVTVSNFLAAFLGNKSGVTGGTGKVVNSGPDDHIFMFYSDHGGPGVLGMPTNPNLFANDLIEAFKMKHEARGYKEMVVYIEACESGSIFEGLLPNNLSIYATTASNADESSWGTYCPGMTPPPPPEYITCLGDLYSVSWMEDSESHNLKEESLKDQYHTVKMRTSNYNTYTSGSHVMQYGDLEISREKVSVYIGNDPSNQRSASLQTVGEREDLSTKQRDAGLLYLWQKYKRADEDSNAKLEAQQELFDALAYRNHLDRSMRLVGKLIFGHEKGSLILNEIRPPGQPLVDNWGCLKAMVQTFEAQCGSLTGYGLRHTRKLANICNAGIDVGEMERASAEACAYSNSHMPLGLMTLSGIGT